MQAIPFLIPLIGAGAAATHIAIDYSMTGLAVGFGCLTAASIAAAAAIFWVELRRDF